MPIRPLLLPSRNRSAGHQLLFTELADIYKRGPSHAKVTMRGTRERENDRERERDSPRTDPIS